MPVNRGPNRAGLEAQRRILAAFDQLQAEQGYPPLVSEVAELAGCPVTTTHYHLRCLTRGGFLHHDPHTSRGFIRGARP